MRLLSIFLFITSLSFGQDTLDTKTSKFYEKWEFIKGPDFPARISGSGYLRFVFEPPDTATYVYTITRHKKVWTVSATTFIKSL